MGACRTAPRHGTIPCLPQQTALGEESLPRCWRHAHRCRIARAVECNQPVWGCDNGRGRSGISRGSNWHGPAQCTAVHSVAQSLQGGAVQSVQCSAVQCSAVQCSAVQGARTVSGWERAERGISPMKLLPLIASPPTWPRTEVRASGGTDGRP